MAIKMTPMGISVQESYRWYRQGRLLVNRDYQRKLVWTVAEKQKLIDSILLGFPLPLILLAETEDSRYEIIDGMQRLNAVFSFIETSYPLKTGKKEEYFNLREFSFARQEGEKGSFKPYASPQSLLSGEKCANLLGYQLAVTIFSGDKTKINEVFLRINSSGRQTSNQEKRQAGISSQFSILVKEISSKIRGDVSGKILKLSDMPVISIDTKKEQHGYKISAENTFWCHHGVLNTKQLRQSEDEEIIADILASILMGAPLFAKNREKLDALYENTKEARKIESAIRKYNTFPKKPKHKESRNRLKKEISLIFSFIEDMVIKVNKNPLFLRKTIMGGKNPGSIKADFYTLFMAFYELVSQEGKHPQDKKGIMNALKGVHGQQIKIQTKHITSEQRRKNIDSVKGLIQKFFIRKESTLGHGPGLALDFENSLNRSKIETSRYEHKQGFLLLDQTRAFNYELIEKIAQTACGMANIGPNSKSYIHIGVADRKEHSEKIKKLDNINPKKTDGFWVVGIDREAKLQNKKVEKYVNFFISELKKTKLPSHLSLSLLKNIDIIDYHGFSVVRITVPAQSKISYYDKDKGFIREHSSTRQATRPEWEEVVKNWNKKR